MSGNSVYYSQFGLKAAKLSFAFPGLGQLHNKQYFKGTLVVSIFGFSIMLLVLLLLKHDGESSPSLIMLLSALPPVIWGVSVFDAYHTAIEKRQRSAARHDESSDCACASAAGAKTCSCEMPSRSVG